MKMLKLRSDEHIMKIMRLLRSFGLAQSVSTIFEATVDDGVATERPNAPSDP